MRATVTSRPAVGTLSDDQVVEGVMHLIECGADLGIVRRRARFLPERIRTRLRKALAGTPYEEAIG